MNRLEYLSIIVIVIVITLSLVLPLTSEEHTHPHVYMTGYYGDGDGGTGDLSIYDKDGNVVQTLTDTDTNTGDASSFLIKYDKDGHVAWAAKQEGPEYNSGVGVSSDTKGNVYMTGYYGSGDTRGDLSIYDKDGNVVQTLTDTNTGDASSFLIKYDKDGHVAWAAKQEGPETNLGYDVSSDTKGNVYMTGYYGRGGAGGDFSIYDKDGNVVQTLTDKNEGYTSSFLIKYHKDGHVAWAAKQEGPESNRGQGVSSDTKGNVYMTGYYGDDGTRGDLSIYDKDGNVVQTLTDTNTGDASSFLIKYDKDGHVAWAAKQEGHKDNVGLSVSSDTKGNVYMSGYYGFGGTGDLSIYDKDGNVVQTLTDTNIGNDSSFLIKYDKDGHVAWAAKQYGPKVNASLSVSSDTKGNVYMTGYYGSGGTGDLSIYDKDGNVVQTLTDTNTGDASSFLIKYHKDGHVAWAAKQEGPESNQGLGVSSDTKGNVYMTGYYGLGAGAGGDLSIYDKDGNVVQTLTDTNTGDASSFLIKYDKDGHVAWAAKQEGHKDNVGLSVSSDTKGNVYMSGYYGFGGTGDLSIYDKDGNVVQTLTDTNIGNDSSFLIKYDKDGHVAWAAKQYGPKVNASLSVSSDTKGNVYMTGYYGSGGTGDLSIYDKDGNVVQTLTDTNTGDASSFLIKYHKDGHVAWAAKQEGPESNSGLSVSSDTKGNVYMTGYYGLGAGDLSIYDKDGNVVQTLTDTNTGDASSFLIKYDKDGHVAWAAKQEGPESNQGLGVSAK